MIYRDISGAVAGSGVVGPEEPKDRDRPTQA
jgi:hypothetical protein